MIEFGSPAYSWLVLVVCVTAIWQTFSRRGLEQTNQELGRFIDDLRKERDEWKLRALAPHPKELADAYRKFLPEAQQEFRELVKLSPSPW